jgi:hypothetical protein
VLTYRTEDPHREAPPLLNVWAHYKIAFRLRELVAGVLLSAGGEAARIRVLRMRFQRQDSWTLCSSPSTTRNRVFNRVRITPITPLDINYRTNEQTNNNNMTHAYT